MNKGKNNNVYSEDFKREKVALLESGKVRICDLVRLYGMDPQSLYNWKKKYGRLPANERVVLEKDSDYKKNLELMNQIEDLERMIGRKQIKLDYYEQVVKLASKEYKQDIEKKFGSG